MIELLMNMEQFMERELARGERSTQRKSALDPYVNYKFHMA
jgi:hypothetical protein